MITMVVCLCNEEKVKSFPKQKHVSYLSLSVTFLLLNYRIKRCIIISLARLNLFSELIGSDLTKVI